MTVEYGVTEVPKLLAVEDDEVLEVVEALELEAELELEVLLVLVVRDVVDAGCSVNTDLDSEPCVICDFVEDEPVVVTSDKVVEEVL